jgi:hypothetical protein
VPLLVAKKIKSHRPVTASKNSTHGVDKFSHYFHENVDTDTPFIERLKVHPIRIIPMFNRAAYSNG